MKTPLKYVSIMALLICSFSLCNIPIYLENAKNESNKCNSNISYSISQTSSSSITILSDSDFLSYGFPGNGSKEDPYRIENLEINTLDYIGIRIENVSKSFIIQNCKVSAASDAIKIFNCISEVINLSNNTCQGGKNGTGILVLGTQSHSLRILNNVCLESYNGLNINRSPNSLIENNTLSRNHSGLRVENDISFSRVINNYCMNNYNGMYIANSRSVLFKNNYICNNINGFLADSTNIEISFQDCVIFNNLFDNNTSYAIIISAFLEPSYSRNNLIYHNTIINNNKNSGSQAKDTGQTNQWYNESLNEGNYWSNWFGFGVYLIDGDANSLDLYPLEKPLLQTITTPPLMFIGRGILIIVITSLTITLVIVIIGLYIKKNKSIKTRI